MNPLVASVIRTLVPAAVGQVAAWLLLVNVVMPQNVADALSTFLGFALTAIYYVGIRVIEQQWPKVGILLGLPKSPDLYTQATATAAAPAAPTKGATWINTVPNSVPVSATADTSASIPGATSAVEDSRQDIHTAAATAPATTAPEDAIIDGGAAPVIIGVPAV